MRTSIFCAKSDGLKFDLTTTFTYKMLNTVYNTTGLKCHDIKVQQTYFQELQINQENWSMLVDEFTAGNYKTPITAA